MRSIIITLSIFLLSTVSFAQSSDKSMALLDEASKQFEQSEGAKLSFTLSPDNPGGGAFAPQKGTAFVKGNKFKLDVPFSTTWFDGSTQWVLIKETKEVNISTPTAQELIYISPMGLLSIYKNGYILEEPKARTYNGRKATEIQMSPIDEKQDLKSVTILLDNRTNNVAMVKFTTRDGNKNKLTISDYDSKKKYTNDMFQFNKYNHPDVEIIDLR